MNFPVEIIRLPLNQLHPITGTPRDYGYFLFCGLHFKILLHYFFIIVFLGLHLGHMEVPRLGVKLELWLPAYARATARPDPSCVCDLPHDSRQRPILNPLGKAKD